MLLRYWGFIEVGHVTMMSVICGRFASLCQQFSTWGGVPVTGSYWGLCKTGRPWPQLSRPVEADHSPSCVYSRGVMCLHEQLLR